MQHVTINYSGLNIADTCYPSLSDDGIVLLKLFVLLYADNTIILSENEQALQSALDLIHE